MREIKRKLLFFLFFAATGAFSSEVERFSLDSAYGKMTFYIDAKNCHYGIKDFEISGKSCQVFEALLKLPSGKIFSFDSKTSLWKEEASAKSAQINDEKMIELKSSEIFSHYTISPLSEKNENSLEKIFIPFESDLGFPVNSSYLILSVASENSSPFKICLKIENKFIKNEKNLSSSEIYCSALNALPEELKRENSCSKSAAEYFSFVPIETLFFYISDLGDNEEFSDSCQQCANLIRKTLADKIETFEKNYVWCGSVCEASVYLKEYLSLLFSKNYPLFTENIAENFTDYKNFSRKMISAEEGKNLAQKAEFYLSRCVEYYLSISESEKTVFSKKLFNSVKNKWSKESENFENDFYDKEFPSDTGNPMPFLAGGFDTPRSFFMKMKIQKQLSRKMNYDWDIKMKAYSQKSFIPGECSGYLKGAGCDGFGMFTGCVFMSGLEDKIFAETKDAANLRNYSKNSITSINFDESGLYSTTDDFSPDSRYSIEDFEKFSLVIPSYSLIRAGDLLLLNSDGEKDLCIVSSVKNSTDKSGIEVIAINKNTLAAKKCLWSELENCQNYVPRRLLCLEKKQKDEVCKKANFDFLSNEISDSSLKISSMKESEQKDNTLWRWIPNTGEWLILSGIDISARNKSGLILTDLGILESQSSLQEVEFCLFDRNFSDEAKNSIIVDNKNINGNVFCNNSLGNYTVSFLDENGNQRDYGTFSYKNCSGKYLLSKSSDCPDLFLRGGKDLLLGEVKICAVQIRPSSSASWFPGDDFLLGIEFNHDGETVRIKSEESSYIAMYDKKMLWRANLYINQREESGTDWNEIHKWNAPPNARSVLAIKNSWWSKDWGYNEWNRIYDGTQNVSNINDLSIGNGGQTVIFQEFSPVRTLTSNVSFPEEKNRITRTVAYSYPYHPFEKNLGDAGSMDSPFDFLWKLNEQYKSRKTRENSSWIPSENKWMNYKKSQNLNGDSTAKNEVKESFLPSMGLFNNQMKHKKYDHIEKGYYEFSAEKNYEAGTDCVGFAQKTASYSNNRYVWPDLPLGIMESTFSTYEELLSAYETNGLVRNYPRTETGEGSVVSAVEILSFDSEPPLLKNKSSDKQEEPSSEKKCDINEIFSGDKEKRLRSIVPGDVFLKDSRSPSSNGIYDDHIGIIAYVPENSSDLSTEELLNKIIVIESTYSAWVQSVVKVFSLADYFYSKNQKKISFYSEKNIFAEGDYKLNCNKISVRRLIMK